MENNEIMKKIIFQLFALLSVVPLLAVEVNDPEFTKNENGVLAAWKNTNKNTVKVVDGTLVVTATKSKLIDSIYQAHRIKPSDAQYLFSVDVDAPAAKCAFIQVKLFARGKELMRPASHAAPAGKSRLFVAASHPAADTIEIAMRIHPVGVGRDFKFSKPVLRVTEDGELFGIWLPGGKGFSVSDVNDRSYTITIDKAEKNHAAMFISRNVVPGKKYVFEADYKSDIPKMGYLEVKYYKKGKELKRKQAYSDNTEGRLSLEVSTDGCDKLMLQCRVPASSRYIGKKVVFSNFKFKEVK